MDKKTKVKLIIGVAIMIVLVIGATYAYFNMGVINTSNSSVITLQTEESGLVTLSVPTPKLKIIVDEEDMAPNNARNYYADDEKNYVLTEEEGTHTITKFEITDATNEDKYECTADITVTMTNTQGSMGEALEQGDLFLHLKGDENNTFEEQELDLFDIKDEGKKVYEGITFKVTGNSSSKIDAYAYLVNKKNDEQDYLADKELDITISADNLKCGEDSGAKLVKKLQSDDTNNTLSDTLVGGMYRYQGTNNEVKSNYLCLEGKCSNQSDEMYRIIGITPEGNIKVIKQTRYGNAIKWWDDNSVNKEWPESKIYSTLNEDYYNSLKEEIKNIIEPQQWIYGDISKDYIDSSISTEEVYKIEAGKENTKYYSPDDGKYIEDRIWTNKIQANIGLMYIHDYAYAESSLGHNTSCRKSDYSTCKSSWIHMSNNGIATSGNERYEWIMTRMGLYSNSDNRYGGWYVTSNGNIDYNVLSTGYAVRPVFYLKSNITLYGSGTVDDPYTLTEVIPTDQEKTLRLADDTETLSKTLVGGMYRYQGADTLKGKNVKNYICLKEVGKNSCNASSSGYDDNMYRIIGITPEGNIKVIKQIRYNKSGTNMFAWNSKSTNDSSKSNYCGSKEGCPAWEQSDMYKTLNDGSGSFLSKLDSTVQEKIEPQKWWYGDIGEEYMGTITSEEVYKIESGQVATQYYNANGILVPKSEGTKWQQTSEESSIGLMYVSDYLYAISATGHTYNCKNNYTTCQGSWIHEINNESSSTTYQEWTMTRIGRFSTGVYFNAWGVDIDGKIYIFDLSAMRSVRPVFYLKNNVKIAGSGTYDNPFYIES